jgi:ABC-2 type transport system ATP-binding protein
MSAIALDIPTTSTYAASAVQHAVQDLKVAELSGVTKRYISTTALDNLSLTLNQGEIVALLGPNGAGKSTAVRLLLGLTSPTAGSVRIFGRDPRDPAARTRTGAMLQVGTAPEVLRVREHLDLFRSYYPAPMALDEIIHVAGLEKFLDKPYGDLSGGQKQRTLFALSIAGDPDLLFLDEPTVGMDIESRRGLWTQIRSLAARGKTVLLTTHYLEEADALATRIVVIARGRILREGTPAVIKSSGNSRTIRCNTALEPSDLLAIPGIYQAERHGATTSIMAKSVEDTLRILLSRDSTLSNLEILAPALEDAFLALTQQDDALADQ